MLKLHHTLSLRSPFSQSSRRIQLITAIEADRNNDVWTLEKTPDTTKLDEFWTSVQEDLKKDPSWFSFDND